MPASPPGTRICSAPAPARPTLPALISRSDAVVQRLVLDAACDRMLALLSAVGFGLFQCARLAPLIHFGAHRTGGGWILERRVAGTSGEHQQTDQCYPVHTASPDGVPGTCLSVVRAPATIYRHRWSSTSLSARRQAQRCGADRRGSARDPAAPRAGITA